MAVKTLRLTKLGRVTSLPISDVHYGQHPTMRSVVSGLMPESSASIVSKINPMVESAREGIENLAIAASRARKPADPSIPLTFIDRVKEFIHFNKPNIDLGAITEILSRVKTPLLVTLGITFAAGLAYLAYKVYQNRDHIPQMINKIMEDIKASVPDLVQVQGWAESIRNEIVDIVHKFASVPSKLISKIAKLKNAVINHQVTINPANVGSGINMIAVRKRKRTAKINGHRKRKVYGSGIKVPI